MDLGSYFPSPSVFFKQLIRNPFIKNRNDEIKIAISSDLKGVDLISLANNKGLIVKVSDDETQLILTNEIHNLVLTGSPTTPTLSSDNDSDSIASTSFVKSQGYIKVTDSLHLDGGTF